MCVLLSPAYILCPIHVAGILITKFCVFHGVINHPQISDFLACMHNKVGRCGPLPFLWHSSLLPWEICLNLTHYTISNLGGRKFLTLYRPTCVFKKMHIFTLFYKTLCISSTIRDKYRNTVVHFVALGPEIQKMWSMMSYDVINYIIIMS